MSVSDRELWLETYAKKLEAQIVAYETVSWLARSGFTDQHPEMIRALETLDRVREEN